MALPNTRLVEAYAEIYPGGDICKSSEDNILRNDGTRRQAKTLTRRQRTRRSHKRLFRQCLSIFKVMVILVGLMGDHVTEASMSRIVAVTEGSPVILPCAAPRTAGWIAYDPGSSTRLYIYTSTVTSPSYRLLHQTDEQYDLSFNAARSFGKRYQCIEEGSGNTIADVEVIVLDVEPECFFTVDKHHITASCSLKFSGNWVPTMQWTWWSGENITVVGDIALNVIPSKVVTSTSSVSKNRTSPWKCQCDISFTESGRPSNTAGSNVPEYSYRWSTEYITFGALQNSTVLCHTHPAETKENSCNTVLVVLFALILTANLFFLAWKFKLCLFGLQDHLDEYCFCKRNEHRTNNSDQEDGV